ncbi:hypothetical protein DYBT9275_01493 [Dyadobacter sp. CECT 9275]|uniref:BioF2-like acetyltransferase domain-containing protein n=1 Tax=Dyadobacter helix TaxID=2822344 RepID=A0A916JAN4_9BACT|nr:GNAT family N-acetyltransferase [Dyadobacter sp. CECT 9275]CAG4994898.1 hypothetical protein DYBT9275_01493 [Dyadobacter sp. CECT 9275]
MSVSPILLSRSDIAEQHWNALIARSRQSVIYGFSWYLDVVCDNWMALVWPSKDTYSVVMPLPVKSKWGFQVIQQPFFCQYLGIFSEDAEIAEEVLSAFLRCLAHQFRYISNYQFNPDNTANIKTALDQSAFMVVPLHTYWLSLADTDGPVSGRYSKDRRENLRRSLSFDWGISSSTDISPLIELFRQNHEQRISGGVSTQAYDLLKNVFEKVLENADAKLLYARKQEIIHAGILLIRAGNRVIYIFNAADRTGREGNARTFLLDYFLSAENGTNTVFDFESPEIESIGSFYKSFGAEKKPFFSIHQNRLPFPLNLLQAWRRRRAADH